jgi:purine-binding chemotaxis protein CheW
MSADAVPTLAAPAQPECATDLACFDVHGTLWGIDVRRIRQIMRGIEAKPLPGAPRWIEGVIDLRETMVPVVDLGVALGASPVGNDRGARIVVVDTLGVVLGLRVGKAYEVLSVEGRTLEAPPALAVRAGYDPVVALVRRDDGTPVLALALERVVGRLLQSVSREEERA